MNSIIHETRELKAQMQTATQRSQLILELVFSGRIMLILLLWISFNSLRRVLTQTIQDEVQLATELIQELREELREEFDASGPDKPLLATVVRLSFHDCGGPLEQGDSSVGNSICNGCVNLNNADNNGLSPAINPLEQIYVFYSDSMSRADFWAAAATIAIEYSHELDGTSTMRAIPFYFGRRDCSTTPNGLQTRAFPHGHAAWTENINWFRTNIGFTTRETIAILGAHTLGQVHVQFSGFGTRPWVRQSFLLNNQYYIDMIEIRWSPVEVNCNSQFGCRWEWHIDRGGGGRGGNGGNNGGNNAGNNQGNNGGNGGNGNRGRRNRRNLLQRNRRNNRGNGQGGNQANNQGNNGNRGGRLGRGGGGGGRGGGGGGNTLMLNSDMALIFEIEPFLNRDTGRVTCDWRDCPINEVTEDTTRGYAQNNQQWINDFADAFELMILTGYSRSELLPVLVPRVTTVNVLGAQGQQRGRRNHNGL